MKRESGTASAPPQLFATVAVARLVGIAPARVRALARSGFCHPSRRGRLYQFTFQDVVLLRAALGLLKGRVPTRRVRTALRQLARQLPQGRPLTAVRISAIDGAVVVHDGGTAWRPESGQVLFSFLTTGLAKRAKVLTATKRRKQLERKRPQDSSDDWFERGLILEQEGNLDQAREAYERAVEIDPEHGDAFVNLGRLFHQRGDAERAGELYHRAIDCQPDDPVAHYNLALALEDQKDLTAAVSHYRKAVEISPDFADAHFNLGRLLDRLGRHTEAVRHLLVYKRLMRES
ncbi:MAG TPA: tetratricopeptide repeat protein [Terriglobales bacterium]|nr:tetratricopeptide repeat protein [Terriglobales bacterium]